MKNFIIASALVSLALVGCTSTTTKVQAPTAQTPTTPITQPTLNTKTKTVQAGQTRFQCDNGLTVFVKQLSPEQIQLNVQNYQAVLDLSPAASGERYLSTKGLFGTGGEWHQKGNEAYFGYKGVHGAVGATTCTVG